MTLGWCMIPTAGQMTSSTVCRSPGHRGKVQDTCSWVHGHCQPFWASWLDPAPLLLPQAPEQLNLPGPNPGLLAELSVPWTRGSVDPREFPPLRSFSSPAHSLATISQQQTLPSSFRRNMTPDPSPQPVTRRREPGLPCAHTCPSPAHPQT